MGFTLTMLISARAAGVPLVVIMPFAGTRPFYEARLGTWPDAFDYLWLRWIPETLLNRLSNWWLLHTRLWISRFNQVARTFGVPELEVALELFQGDYTLLSDIPEITGVAQLPSNYHYVGPIIAQLEGEVPPAILHLPHDRPIVYFAMGSSGNPEIVREILPGFGECPYRVIAPIQSHLDSADVRIPDNVLVTGWLPAHKVNPLADISVIHGGQGTVQTACLSGTPIVGVGMQPEQEANLDFLVRKGMAIRIRKRRVTARAVLEAINCLLSDGTARQSAREVQQALQQWDGPCNVAKFLGERFGG
jgi:UDP:flavonoid glycosyltransferase YjiC (YdhE family)